eukprot:312753_1
MSTSQDSKELKLLVEILINIERESECVKYKSLNPKRVTEKLTKSYMDILMWCFDKSESGDRLLFDERRLHTLPLLRQLVSSYNIDDIAELLALGFDLEQVSDAMNQSDELEADSVYHHEEEQETNKKQTYNERIDMVLKVIESERTDRGQIPKQDIYHLVEKQYQNKKGINGFVEDCGEYVMNIDTIYADHVNKCDLEDCVCIKREFRDRNVYDKNEKKRFKLYSQSEDEKSVVIQQFVDQMH